MTTELATVTAAVVARFRRQRPLRGGSLLVTIFGDSIAPRGGAITLGSLIDLAKPFGLNERLVRTAMARLADEDWLDNRRLGRRSEYRLSAGGRRRFAAATEQIYAVPAERWTGVWTVVLLSSVRGAARQDARDTLLWAGFGEATPGVLVHPALTTAEVAELEKRTPALASAVVLTTTPATADANRRLAASGWDLSELATRYRRFIGQFTPVRAALEGRERPEALSSFLLRTLLIHEYRKIHLRDPLLPIELLPADWVGADAYRLCRTVYERMAPLAEPYLSEHAARLDGPLAPADAEFWKRFGGLKPAPTEAFSDPSPRSRRPTH